MLRTRLHPAPLVALVADALLALPATVAQAAGNPEVVGLADYVEGSPQLGVDFRGGAVATWMQSAERAGGKPYETVRAVFASVRRAHRGFAAPRRISSADRGVRFWTTAVGERGHGAIVWQSDRAGSPLFVNRQRPGGNFGTPSPLPGSEGALEPTATIDGSGRVLVAWLRASGRDRCGMVVMVSRAPRDARFSRPRRVSGPCAHAQLVRAALARNGEGAVAWRSAGARSAVSTSSIEVSAYSGGWSRAARTVSAAPGVGFTLQLAAGGSQALVVWRDHGDAGQRSGGRVLAASIDGGRTLAPVEIIATRDALLRDVHAAMSPRDAAIAAWQQAAPGSSVFEAFDARGVVALRSTEDAPFGAPETVAENVELESSYGLTGLAIDVAGRAVAGHDAGIARRSPTGSWVDQRMKPRPIDVHNERTTNGDMSVGVSDAGEAVAVWSLYSQDGGYYVRAVVLPAPR